MFKQSIRQSTDALSGATTWETRQQPSFVQRPWQSASPGQCRPPARAARSRVSDQQPAATQSQQLRCRTSLVVQRHPEKVATVETVRRSHAASVHVCPCGMFWAHNGGGVTEHSHEIPKRGRNLITFDYCWLRLITFDYF